MILLKDQKGILTLVMLNTVRIHYEREGGIEKSVPRITDLHQEA